MVVAVNIVTACMVVRDFLRLLGHAIDNVALILRAQKVYSQSWGFQCLAAFVQMSPTPTRTSSTASKAPVRKTASPLLVTRKQEPIFAALMEGLTVHGDWVGMSDFLKVAKEPHRHAERYLDGRTSSKVCKLNGELLCEH